MQERTLSAEELTARVHEAAREAWPSHLRLKTDIEFKLDQNDELGLFVTLRTDEMDVEDFPADASVETVWRVQDAVRHLDLSGLFEGSESRVYVRMTAAGPPKRVGADAR